MRTDSDKPLRLALIGMSGAGKTHWTKNLAALGCPTISCDDRIEERLAPILQRGGYSGINGVAAWMGWPDRSTYAEREAAYLAEEISTLDEALAISKKIQAGSRPRYHRQRHLRREPPPASPAQADVGGLSRRLC